MSDRAEYMLYALSAWREMSWGSFREIFDALCVKLAAAGTHEDGSTRIQAWSSLRALECLGHADTAWVEGRGKIMVAPAALCRLPFSGSPQAILCGARAPGTRAALERACEALPCSLSVELQSGEGACRFLPARFAVESETEEALSQLASRLQVPLSAAPPAWALLEYSGTAGEYASSCPAVQAPEINWPKFDFDSELLQFCDPQPSRPVVRLSKYQHPTRGTTLYQLWNGGAYQNVDRDWGRYLILQSTGRNVLAYDRRHCLMAVPATAPLPRLIARACALCSGYAAHPAKTGGPSDLLASCAYEVFLSVPPDIAAAVAAKVGQKLVDAKLDGLLEG